MRPEVGYGFKFLSLPPQKNAPMRILVVSNFYPPRAIGGAELVAHRHALEMKKRGHEVRIFAGRPPKSNQSGGELDMELVDRLDVYLLSIRSLEPDRAFRWDAAGRRLRAVLHDFRPEVVHFHNLSGLGANLILEVKRFGAKTICTVHDHWGFCAKNTLYRDGGYVCKEFEECHFCVKNVSDENGKALPTRLRRDYVMSCLSEVDALVFPSRYLERAYAEAGFDTCEAHVQSNGVDIEKFEASPSPGAGPLHFAFIGYLGVHKGTDLVLDMVERLLAEPSLDGRWRLSIVGDGALRTRVSRLVEVAPHRDYVSFLGKLAANEIPAFLASSDVVLLPSVWPENEPVVMLEAIASGRAQLASRIGGHTELVVDGKSGLLFTSGDLNDLITKAVAYIESPALARQHGDFNRARRETVAQNIAVSAYEKIYAQPRRRVTRTDKIVLCDGQWPTLETAQFFNNFSLFEKRRKLRFIYADWADTYLWEQASAFFCWSHDANPRLAIRSVRMNIPVIAPAGSAIVRLCEEQWNGGFGYKDFPEAIAALLAIAERDHVASGHQARAIENLIDCAAALVDADAFSLTAERAVT